MTNENLLFSLIVILYFSICLLRNIKNYNENNVCLCECLRDNFVNELYYK